MKEELRRDLLQAQAGDKPAMDRLLAENSALVRSVARRLFGRGCEPEDQFQLGSIGLMKAIRGFDLSQPVAFSTYAVPKIAGEMRRFLRDDGPVKVSRTLRERAFALRQVQTRLERENGHSPRLSDLCRETGLQPEEVLEALQAPRDTDSLDAALPGQDRTLGDILSDRREEGALVETLALREAIDRLEPLLRQVILLRYMRDLTQQRIAVILGLTQVQVSRMEKKARAQLKQALTE